VTTNAFELESFSGTLADLVSEVRRRAVDILRVPLARVTSLFLRTLGAAEPADPVALAEFCDDATRLLLAKSRALLPRERERADEDADADPGELEARIQAYRRYREAADVLHQREEQGLRAYARSAPPQPSTPEPSLAPPDVTALDLADAFRAALAAVPEEQSVAPEHVRPHTVRIADRLAGIRALLRSRRRVTFLEALTDGPRTREFVIVSFLAVLELLRRAAIRVSQDQLFGDIVLEVTSEAALDAAAEAAATFLDEE
jgi:segregation and condensation protein A